MASDVNNPTAQSVTMHTVYQSWLSDTRSLSANVKSSYADFLSQHESFFNDEIHKILLFDSKSDGSAERSCSICHRELPIDSQIYSFFLLNRVPLIRHQPHFRVACCDNIFCEKHIQEYAKKIHEMFGPFFSNELAKTSSYIDNFGQERTNYDTLFIANDIFGWNFSGSIYIHYDSKKDDLEVIVDLARRNIGRSGNTTISLEELIANNLHVNFCDVADEMPNTPGGHFIKSYIYKKLNTTTFSN